VLIFYKCFIDQNPMYILNAADEIKHTHLYIYIYIYRERERERDEQFILVSLTNRKYFSPLALSRNFHYNH